MWPNTLVAVDAAAAATECSFHSASAAVRNENVTVAAAFFM